MHDMRNPLSGIVLYTQLLQRQGEYNAEQQHFLSQIQGEAQRLRTLLEQMQLLSKLQQGPQRLRRQWTDLRMLLREVTNQYNTHITAQHQDLLVTFPSTPVPPLLINRPLVQYLFETLVSHAIRFTAGHTGVMVEMVVNTSSGYGDSHPLLQIIIIDQGPPLPELPAVLYAAVETWDVIAAERAGAGLSLALCQMIAEAHEGTLVIANHRPTGVRFVVTLPIPSSE